jgi:hypothetical protein
MCRRVPRYADPMRFASILTLAAIAMAGCGGSTVDETGSVGAGGGAGTLDAGSDGESPNDAPAEDWGDQSLPDVTPVGHLEPSLVSASFHGDCMPEVPSDALGGSFVASYDNGVGAAPATAAITSAKLVHHANGAPDATFGFDVTPSDAGPVAAGAATSVTHTKVDGSAPGSDVVCQKYCGGEWSLEVTWTTGAGMVKDTLPAMVGCAL